LIQLIEKPILWKVASKNCKNINIHYSFFNPALYKVEPKGKILLVHVWRVSTCLMEKNVQDLQNERLVLVITVDLPGFGYSDKRAQV